MSDLNFKHRGTYTVIATGRTFPVKDDLRSWAFTWDHLRKAWIATGVEQGSMNLFKHNVSSGEWEGVDLEITEEPESDIDRIMREAGDSL